MPPWWGSARADDAAELALFNQLVEDGLVVVARSSCPPPLFGVVPVVVSELLHGCRCAVLVVRTVWPSGRPSELAHHVEAIGQVVGHVVDRRVPGRLKQFKEYEALGRPVLIRCIEGVPDVGGPLAHPLVEGRAAVLDHGADLVDDLLPDAVEVVSPVSAHGRELVPCWVQLGPGHRGVLEVPGGRPVVVLAEVE